MTAGIGLIGCGRIGQLHARHLAGIEGLRLAAVCDAVPTASASLAAELDVPVADDPSALMARSDVDAVAICSPTESHVDLVVAAAEAGLPAFCEKPISLDLAEAERAVSAVVAAGTAVQLGFNRRFDPSHRAVATAARDGELGELHIVRITSRDPAPPPQDYVAGSGGIFADMMIHDFDMARFVTGAEVAEVYAAGAVRIDPAIGELGDWDTAAALLTHADGTITTIDNSRQAVYGYDQRVEAFGSAGAIASQNPTVHDAVRSGPAGTASAPMPWFFTERYAQSYRAEWAAFVEVLAGGQPPVTLEDGRACLAIALAATRSAREGRPVSVAETSS
ncbi:MAG: inositol 2-dehydrogenase [Acidimicrobiales bacterium]|nr:inositol 2-dehydrogenase [Acidimicrobiales bacterium]MYG62171.1 inositol 2-dehydrogenase [Acidimicrobiales bacterium]MYJ46120.1 inositol 2-dehydrogenase [Acidimicrobiales bacterium]